MSDSSNKPPSNDRRRVSRIVHDERGNARVEWIEVEDSRQNLIDRLPLEVEDTTPPSRSAKSAPLAMERAKPKGFDPYQRVDTAGRVPSGPKRAPAKRDLRKLGEWLKIKREVEERRARGEFDEEE